MKKTIWIIGAILIGYVGHSQVLIGMLFGDRLNQGPIEFGLNISTNISDITNLEHSRRTVRAGFGLYFDYNTSKRWTFSASMYFKSPRGAQNLYEEDLFFDMGDGNISTDRDIERQLNYVELPVEAFYNINESMSLGAGAYLSYLHGTLDIVTAQLNGGEITYTKSFTGNMTRWDFGLQFHVRYHFKGEPGPQLRVGYARGLVDIYTSSDLTAYNDAVQIQFLIPIKMGIK